MTFEERIHEYCLQSDIVYERILSSPCEKDLYVLYPSELANEQILQDNIPKMLKVIKEYISELELCAYCMRKVDNLYFDSQKTVATVYKGNIIKNLIMDCQSYTKYRPNETTGGIFVSWRRKEELPTGA